VTAILHEAGPVVAARQCCARCGTILVDYTGKMPMIPIGQDPGLTFWAPGPVAVDGGASWTDNSGSVPACRPVS